MWRMGTCVAAGAVILANGYLYGLATNRWHRSAELEAAVARIARVPETISDWKTVQSDELSEAVTTVAGIDGYMFRRYENARTGKSITVLLMCGLPGPISVHSPDICYRGVGYDLDGSLKKEAQKFGNDLKSAEFWRAKFSKSSAGGAMSLQVRWSWNADGRWLAPDNTRLTFASFSSLYKLYIIQHVTPSSERLDEATCNLFLEQLLPVLDKALFART
jgi:hypothetical protein